MQAPEVKARPRNGGRKRGWYLLPSGGYVEAVLLRKLCRALPAHTQVAYDTEGLTLTWRLGRGRIRLTGTNCILEPKP